MDELHLRQGNKEAGSQMSQGHTWPPDLQAQSPPRSGQAGGGALHLETEAPKATVGPENTHTRGLLSLKSLCSYTSWYCPQLWQQTHIFFVYMFFIKPFSHCLPPCRPPASSLSGNSQCPPLAGPSPLRGLHGAHTTPASPTSAPLCMLVGFPFCQGSCKALDVPFSPGGRRDVSVYVCVCGGNGCGG